MLRLLYSRYILSYPKTVIFLIVATIAFLGYQAQKLEIDASAETLVLEDDADLRFTRLVNERYGNPDFLFVTFAPKGDLLSDETLAVLKRLRSDLEQLPMIESVLSILNVPLLQSPPKPVKELLKDVPTLESHKIDKALAKKEFLNSPIYRNMLVSPDFKTTALQINLREDPMYMELLNRRNALRQKEKEGTIAQEEKSELEEVIVRFKQHRDAYRVQNHKDIRQIRDLLERYRQETGIAIFLGGVSMIADDLVTFLKNDLKFFGSGVLLFLIVTLWIIFKQIRWILFPILCCAFSVVATSGILGLFGWEVTVISSNFISIQIIITMAITIHLIVRYRELCAKCPEADQRQLVLESVLSMARPCLYATLTTVAGFSSLVLCDILPVINFGWMMSAGIGISLVLAFLLFPSVMMLAEKLPPDTSFEKNFALTRVLARITESHGRTILLLGTLALLFSVWGAARLKVENSFIDYFKKSTEIYKGMKVIDRQLGGTTPLDVIIDFKGEEATEEAAKEEEGGEMADEEDFDAFGDLDEEFEQAKNEAQYWFTADKMEIVEKAHDYLETIPEIGKVVSLGTMLKVGRTMNDGKPLDNFMLALVYNELPERFRKIILLPYVSVENNQVRFSARVVDSDPNLRRNELLQRVKRELPEKLAMEKENVRLASLMVMYNNMLQSLFDSQIKTLGAVIAALMLMFLILFRSLKIAVIAIFPNILSVGFVLGFMGWMGIPLDMMTITIASISVGIAVDDTIHYIHRFIDEFPKDRNYIATMHRCHDSIGYAMYYTSVTIIIGFSILIISNFIPSIYFGLLTGLAMAIALIAALSLLPRLMILIKPLGPEGEVKT